MHRLKGTNATINYESAGVMLFWTGAKGNNGWMHNQPQTESLP